MKSLNYQVDVSPEIVKLGVVVAAILIAWVANSYLAEATVKMTRQAIYGEQSAPSVASTKASAQKLVSLAIVQSSATIDQSSLLSNDQQIEEAFSIPIPPASLDVKEAEQKKVVSPVLVFFSRYNPSVSGVTSNGAFINGHFYTVSESILAMPVLDTNGRVMHPRLIRVLSNTVELDLGGTRLPLHFTSY